MQKFIEKIKSFAVFLSRNKDSDSAEVSEIFIMLTAVLSTGILMWSYTANSYFTIEDVYHLKYLSLVYVLIHTLSPLLYKIIPSRTVITYVFVGAGFCFQFHHALATGGFYSNTLVWFSILPLIVGLIVGLKHMLIWMVVAISGVALNYYLTINGLSYNSITEVGRIWAQINIAIGYILVNVALIFVYSEYRQRTLADLELKEKKIRSLFRVLVHDISTPLTFILFGHQKITKLAPSEDIKIQLDKILKGTNVIRKIIESTRKYENLTVKSKKLKLVPCDLNQCLEEALALLRPVLDAKKITVSSDVPSKSLVLGDQDMITSQVFINILTNSIKFSHPGSTIEIKVEKESLTNKSHLAVSIQDSGIGIPEEILMNLFDEQSCNSREGTCGELGTGFGMPIVAMMMSKFNGEVSVKSQTTEKSGTCFTLKFERAAL